MTTKNILIPCLLAAAMLPFQGCTDNSKKAPKGKTLPGVVTKIDLQTRNVAMKIKQEDGSESEQAGTLSDDTEILINGRGAKLADVRIGEKVEVTVQKSKTVDGKYDVKKVNITRAAESDWKPTTATNPPTSTTPPTATPVNPPATNPPTTMKADATPNETAPVPDMGMAPDQEQAEQDLADLIYAQIRVRMEEALARRADLIKTGTPLSDPRVAEFERQVIRARSFLAERGELLEEVSPPLAGLPAPDATTETSANVAGTP